MSFNEDSRVKIPALITLVRLGFKYVSLHELAQSIGQDMGFDKRTNIFTPSFAQSLLALNPTLKHDEIPKILDRLALLLSYDDKGKAFYETLIYGLGNHNIERLGNIALIDWEESSKNIFEVMTELPYGGDETSTPLTHGGLGGRGSFRPDITLFINGMPLCFIEVKKPNNTQGIQAEIIRAKERFTTPSYKPFFNLTQIIMYSNNCEYDPSEQTLLSGAFYTSSYSTKLNHFKEEQDILSLINLPANYTALDSAILEILQDTNTQAIASTPEFQSNLSPTTPTNRLLISLFSHERLMFFLRYGIAFVQDSRQDSAPTTQKHIMRYPQFFASLALREKLLQWHAQAPASTTSQLPLKRGIIWHTQGSGKTAFSYYCVRWMRDFYQKRGVITRFYFIVDRIDLLMQACSEFRKRGLHVKQIESKQDFLTELQSLKSSHTGADEMIVVNIQKFTQDSIAMPNVFSLDVQRVFFIDEAHRSYDIKGSFLANLFNVDKNAAFLSLTGTPLLGSTQKLKSNQIFGEYIHKYYYNASISDGYTLRLIKEDIQASYKACLREALHGLEIEQGSLDPKMIYAHKSYVAPMYEYIKTDFLQSKMRLKDGQNIGAMVICHSSEQARALFALASTESSTLDSGGDHHSAKPPISSALILHDSDDKPTREANIQAFKDGKIDMLFVFNMLLTGFDAPRLKKLYLHREIRSHNLLQALTRVNRPYKSFHYGYVVDFADIDKEFDKTNKAYWDELNEQLGGDISSYTDLFKTPAEVESELDSIQNALWDYDTHNAERFRIQIEQCPKEKLLELKSALERARELYNLISLAGFHALESKLDFAKFRDLLKVLEDRLALLRQQEIINTDTTPQDLLNLALEDIVFSFKKIDEKELQLADSLRSSIQNARRSLDHARSMDDKDPEFIELFKEFQRLVSKRGIEPTLESMSDLKAQFDKLHERISTYNATNARLSAKYNDDAKFLRIHKRVRESAIAASAPLDDRTIYEQLFSIKSSLDTFVLNNQAILENPSYFIQHTTQQTRSQAKALLDSRFSIDTRKAFVQLITDEYLHQYQGA